MALSEARLAAAIEAAFTKSVDGTLQRGTIAQQLASAIIAEICSNAEVIGTTSGEHVLPVTGHLV